MFDPIAPVFGTDTGTSSNPTCPTINPGVTDGDVLVIRFVGNDDGRDNTTDGGYPAGEQGLFYRNSSSVATGCAAGAAWKIRPGNALTGTAAFQLTATEGWTAWTVAIKKKKRRIFLVD